MLPQGGNYPRGSSCPKVKWGFLSSTSIALSHVQENSRYSAWFETFGNSSPSLCYNATTLSKKTEPPQKMLLRNLSHWPEFENVTSSKPHKFKFPLNCCGAIRLSFFPGASVFGPYGPGGGLCGTGLQALLIEQGLKSTFWSKLVGLCITSQSR